MLLNMSDSDDDVPLAAKVPARKLEGKAATGSLKQGKGKKLLPDDMKQESKSPQPKKAKTSSSGKSDAAIRVKKEYDLPGQTREAPAENDPLRKFYVTLLDQRPGSQMARKWCVQHGLLPREEAEKWVQENKRASGAKSPSKVGARPAVKRKSSDEPSKSKRPGPAAVKKKPAVTAKKAAQKEESDAGWSSDDKDEVLPAKKQRTSMPESKGAVIKPPLIPRKQPQQSAKKKDVAFADGGLGSSDSDDDVPLLARKKIL